MSAVTGAVELTRSAEHDLLLIGSRCPVIVVTRGVEAPLGALFAGVGSHAAC
jgi:hypothetical protein